MKLGENNVGQWAIVIAALLGGVFVSATVCWTGWDAAVTAIHNYNNP